MWFGVSLLFQSVRADEAEEDALWEERIVLLQAANEATAQEEAQRLGKADEHDYEAADGGLIRWVFVQVDRVYPLLSETVESGTEVFSRFLRPSEVESLLTPFEE